MCKKASLYDGVYLGQAGEINFISIFTLKELLQQMGT
jgi:hypothetical protein